MQRQGRRRGAARFRSWCAVFLLLVLGSVLGNGVGPASAHAELIASSPADGGRVEQAPSFVSLRFSEPVNVPADGLVVIGPDGERVDTGEPVVSGGDVQIALEPGVGEGGYVVTWRMISADSHPIRGGISFVVGDGPAPTAGATETGSDRPWKVAAAALRFVTYAAAALLVGGALFLVVVHDGGPDARWLSRVLAVAALATIFGALLQLPVHAALATGQGPASLFGDSAGEVLAGGVGWSIGLVVTGAVLGLEALLLSRGDRRILAAAGLPVLILIPLGFAVAGHTTTGPGSDWATASDALHTLAGAVWFGGLVLLLMAWRARRRSDEPMAAAGMVRRFSTVATAAVLVVSVAGVALGWREVRTWDGLWGTAYGRVLLVKVLVVAAVIALGAFNQFRLLPRLGDAEATGHDQAWRRLGTTIRYEAIALVAVFALTGVLVDLTPPQRQVTEPAGSTEQRVEFGESTLDLLVEGGAGNAQVHGTILGPEGTPMDIDPEQVTVSFELPSAGLGPIERPVTPISPGHFSVDGSAMNVPGDWRITVTARVSRFDEVAATTEVTLPA